MNWKTFCNLVLLCLIPLTAYCGVDFNGDGDYVSVSAFDPYDGGITVSALVAQGVDTSTERTIWRAGVNYLNFVARYADLRWEVTTTGGNRQLFGGDTLVEGVPTYVAATYDDITQKIYQNGVEDTTASLSETASFGSVTTAIGSRPGSENWDGEITEVCVWNTALTATEIALLHNSKIKGIALQIQPSRLKLYLPMDDISAGDVSISGDIYLDLSGNENNGTGVDDDGDSINVAETILSYPSPILGGL